VVNFYQAAWHNNPENSHPDLYWLPCKGFGFPPLVILFLYENLELWGRKQEITFLTCFLLRNSSNEIEANEKPFVKNLHCLLKQF
jgi:hypothetical protein